MASRNHSEYKKEKSKDKIIQKFEVFKKKHKIGQQKRQSSTTLK